MASALAGIFGMLVLATLCCMWRAVSVFRTRVPAAATVTSSSYTQQLQDQDAPWRYGWYNRGKPGVRLIRDQVRFEDGDGHSRSASVSRWISRRLPPASTYVVWYDRNDTGRVTANGPSYWLGFAAILICIVIGLAVSVHQVQAHAHMVGAAIN